MSFFWQDDRIWIYWEKKFIFTLQKIVMMDWDNKSSIYSAPPAATSSTKANTQQWAVVDLIKLFNDLPVFAPDTLPGNVALILKGVKWSLMRLFNKWTYPKQSRGISAIILDHYDEAIIEDKKPLLNYFFDMYPDEVLSLTATEKQNKVYYFIERLSYEVDGKSKYTITKINEKWEKKVYKNVGVSINKRDKKYRWTITLPHGRGNVEIGTIQ